MRISRAAVALLALALTAAATPAAAESITVADPRDRRSGGLDIRRAHFTNTGADIGGTLVFHSLGKQGTVQLTIDSSDSAALRLEARRTLDGTLRKHLTYLDDEGLHDVDCKIGHTWTGITETVRLIVSRHCLRGDPWGRRLDLDHTRFSAATFRTWEIDRTRQVRVRRTD